MRTRKEERRSKQNQETETQTVVTTAQSEGIDTARIARSVFQHQCSPILLHLHFCNATKMNE